MAAFSYNQFFSAGFRQLSATKDEPTVILDGDKIPSCGHILLLSVFVSNKSNMPQVISMGIDKVDEPTTTLMSEVEVPVGQPFDLLGGSKVVVNKNDLFKMWTNEEGQTEIEVVVSYTVYTPSDLLIPQP